jgi:hypothetical protein
MVQTGCTDNPIYKQQAATHPRSESKPTKEQATCTVRNSSVQGSYGTPRPLLWSSGQSSWLQNGDVLWSLWGTNWIYICYVEESRPPLWSSGQSSWLHNGDILFPARYELNLYVMWKKVNRLCGLVVRVPGYRTEMYCFLWGTNWIYTLCRRK